MSGRAQRRARLRGTCAERHRRPRQDRRLDWPWFRAVLATLGKRSPAGVHRIQRRVRPRPASRSGGSSAEKALDVYVTHTSRPRAAPPLEIAARRRRRTCPLGSRAENLPNALRPAPSILAAGIGALRLSSSWSACTARAIWTRTASRCAPGARLGLQTDRKRFLRNRRRAAPRW